jgi:hypothetical protein
MLCRETMKLHVIKHHDPAHPEDKHRLSDFLTKQFESTLLPMVQIQTFDAIDAAKNGYHIVTVAALSLTHYSAVCEFGFGISPEEQERQIRPILEKKKTGTFFPNYKLTVLPFRYHTTRIRLGGEYDYTHGSGFSIEEVETHIKDAIHAERDIVREGRVLFDFRDFGTDMLRYRNTLTRFLSTEYSHHDWECYFYSYDNSEFEAAKNA